MEIMNITRAPRVFGATVATLVLAGCGSSAPAASSVSGTTAPLSSPSPTPRGCANPAVSPTTTPRASPAPAPVAAVPAPGAPAALAGTAFVPSALVVHATGQIALLVAAQVGALDVTTSANGAFSLPNALGGRYRVRAWQAPGLAQMGSEVWCGSEGEAAALR